MRKLVSLICCIVAVLILSSCEMFEDTFNVNVAPYEPTFVVTLNSVIQYPRGMDIEQTVNTIQGKSITINRNAFLDGTMIMDAVAIQREDDPQSYDMSLKLNKTGLKVWFQLVMDYQNSDVVIMIDDAYYGRFRPDDGHNEDTEWVTLRGPFNEVFATGIERFTKKNYRELKIGGATSF